MKVKLTVPESLNEIKLKDYQKYAVYERDNPEDADLLKLKMIQHFCGLKIKDIRSVKASDIEEIVLDITKSFEGKKELIRHFKYDGVEYGFIPDLENISFGEYIDLNTYLGDIENMHKAMAVLYRPVSLKTKDMYLIEEYEGSDKYADIMKESPLDVYLGAQVFFYTLITELAQTTLQSLEDLPKDSAVRKILEESGVGIPQFMRLLGETSRNMMRSLN